MKITLLYVCNEDRATTKQRLMALKDLPVDTTVIYTSLLDEKITLIKKIRRAISFRLRFFPERNNENKSIISQLKQKQYDILFIEKGLSIRPSTLIAAKRIQPSIRIASYTLDDTTRRNNSSVYYRRSMPLYDFHFTNKKYNVPELKQMGCKNVIYFKNGYSPNVHQLVILTEEEIRYFGSEVSFIGTYEKERAELLLYLAGNGIRLKIWGWGKSAASSGMVDPNIIMTDKYVFDDEYSKVVNASKINLCF